MGDESDDDDVQFTRMVTHIGAQPRMCLSDELKDHLFEYFKARLIEGHKLDALKLAEDNAKWWKSKREMFYDGIKWLFDRFCDAVKYLFSLSYKLFSILVVFVTWLILLLGLFCAVRFGANMMWPDLVNHIPKIQQLWDQLDWARVTQLLPDFDWSASTPPHNGFTRQVAVALNKTL